MLKWCVFTVCKHVYDTGSGGGGGAKWGRRADPMFIGDRLRSMQLVRIINEPQPINSTSVRVTWQLRRIPAHYIDGYRVSYRVLPDYDQSIRNVEDDASFMEDTVLGGSVMTHVIVGLQKYTVYEIFVQPFFRDTVGQQSNVIRVRTAEDGNFWSPRLATSHYCQQLTLSVCHAPLNCFFFFVSRWNRAIFWSSVLHVALYKLIS